MNTHQTHARLTFEVAKTAIKEMKSIDETKIETIDQPALVSSQIFTNTASGTGCVTRDLSGDLDQFKRRQGKIAGDAEYEALKIFHDYLYSGLSVEEVFKTLKNIWYKHEKESSALSGISEIFDDFAVIEDGKIISYSMVEPKIDIENLDKPWFPDITPDITIVTMDQRKQNLIRNIELLKISQKENPELFSEFNLIDNEIALHQDEVSEIIALFFLGNLPKTINTDKYPLDEFVSYLKAFGWTWDELQELMLQPHEVDSEFKYIVERDLY
jgi:hypothetical protein